MDQILSSLRTLLIDHLAETQTVTANVPLGSNIVHVSNTSRLRVDDEIYLISSTAGFAETSTIKDILDDKTLVISPNTVRGWTVAEGTYIQKAINHQLIKRIHIGDLKVIPDFPTITIVATDETNEWMTLGATSHEYKISIRAYVLADSFETTNTFLIKLAKQIREILIDHIRPIISGDSYPLTADLPAGGKIVKVTDTSSFLTDLLSDQKMCVSFIRDANPRPAQQENYIKTVIDNTTLELKSPAMFDYLVSRQAEIIRVNRLLYDSRPGSISYGYISKGASLLQAADISWFAKEMLCRQGNIFT